MSKKKLINPYKYQDVTILDKILWFIEIYLPQKKKRSSPAKISLDKFESFTFQKIKNLTSNRSKVFKGDLKKMTLTFTIGNWSLPYLKFLKIIKLLK